MNHEPIAITGLAAASPIGNDLPTIVSALKEGVSGIKPVTRFDVSAYPSKQAGVISDFSPQQFVKPALLRRLDKLSQFGAALAFLALNDAGIQLDTENRERIGVIWGTGFGSSDYTDEFFSGLVKSGPANVNPSLFPYTVPNAAPSNIAIIHNLKGPNTTFSQKEISCELALMYGCSLINKGLCDVVIVGGGDEISPFLFRAFSSIKALSPRSPDFPEACKPYDKQRNGLVLGEAVGVVVLESKQHREQRQARVYAEIAGFGFAGAPYGLSAYDKDGQCIIAAIERTLEAAQLERESLDWIHGTANGTDLIDVSELKAIAALFAANTHPVTLSSTRPLIGYLDGFGVMKTIFACLAFEHQFIPGTCSLEHPIDAIPLGTVQLPTASLAYPLSHALLLSSSNGGGTMGMALTKASSR